MEREIIGQVLGIVATALMCISYQMKTKKFILLMQTIGVVFICLSFFFLDAMSGFVLNIVCIARNIIFYFVKPDSKSRYITLPVLCTALLILGIASWQGPASLLITVALMVNTVFLSVPNPQTLRKSILLTSSMILIYNVCVFSIGGMANELVAIISSAVGLIRFRYKKNDNENLR